MGWARGWCSDGAAQWSVVRMGSASGKGRTCRTLRRLRTVPPVRRNPVRTASALCPYRVRTAFEPARTLSDRSAVSPSRPPVIRRVSGGIGLLELDRPAALNALDLAMIRLLTEALEDWRDDPEVRSVLVRSTSPKAFCSGGDIRAVRAAGLRGDDAAVLAYFSAEYGLNALIGRASCRERV